MNDYEIKQEERRERLRKAAEKARANSEAGFDAAHRIADNIPLGQPILVGHHSEGRARRDVRRIDAGMRKGIDEAKRAAELEARADAVGTGGISADDPEAAGKIRERIDELKKKQALWKRVNLAHRAWMKDPHGGTLETKYGDLGEAILRQIREYVPEYSWLKHPVAPYQFTNLGNNIRRLEERLVSLARRETDPPREQIAGEGFTIEEDRDENRVVIRFAKRQPREVIEPLKRTGFRWSPTRGAWLRQLNNGAWQAAKYVAGQIAGKVVS